MGERTQKGTIVREKGKFYLKMKDRREELPLDTVIDSDRLERLVGKDVEVLLSEPRQAVVGIRLEELLPILCYIPWPPWPPCFLCYLPAPWLIKGVELEVQRNLAKRFLEEGYINEEVFKRLI
jgi:hypothetical protein